MEKNYNLIRKRLILPEYGRHVQNMIETLMSIEDQETRNKQARAIVGVMGNANPHLKDTIDFKHKLWDHLFIMSDFKLKIDSPYPMPTQENVSPKPSKVPYPVNNIKLKHYGKNVEKMLLTMKSIEDTETKRELATCLAKYMRDKSHEFNNEHPSNETVLRDMKFLSQGDVTLASDSLEGTKSSYRPNNGKKIQKKNPKQHMHSNNKQRKQNQKKR